MQKGVLVMNKWQDLLKHRIHNSKVKAAKSIVLKNLGSHPPVKHNISQHLQQSSLSNNPPINHVNSSNDPQLSQALKKHGLQQYSRQLSLKGYLDSPKKLRDLIQSDRLTTVQEQIKLLPGHKTKLITMLSSLQGHQQNKATLRLPQIKLPERFAEQNSVSVSQNKSKGGARKDVINSSRLSAAEDYRKNKPIQITKTRRQSYKINISSSTKSLKPAIKRGMSKLTKSRLGDSQIDLKYRQQMATYRSFDGAKLHSSLHSLDMSEMAECMAMDIVAEMRVVKLRKQLRAGFGNSQELFQRVKQRNQPEEDFMVVEEERDYGVFQEHEDQSPDVNSVGNYIKNILTGAKLEAYLVPAATALIHRLKQQSKNIKLTNLSYQKIILCSLILAGKLFSDSYLSKPFKIGTFMPSHRRITELERLFLFQLNYNISVTPEQYASAYFKLRSFIKRDKQTLKTTNVSKRYGAKLQSFSKVSQLSKDPHRITKQVFARRSF